MSPTSTLTSLCEDADSGNSDIVSNGWYIIKHDPYNLIWHTKALNISVHYCNI
jgi:hypothetical protein